ncbi:MAG: hypothetical protein IJO71_11340 [Microbacterium sp.]|uniref:hypothetical protein n=1 Tax=Microbacterium sp. TaxID=51671 RepID=UPI0025E5A219|nr:hypothetical protein [Microbacterium sp.]MBQ9917777.1 hypothetical protein [Microbacterium sp.]
MTPTFEQLVARCAARHAACREVHRLACLLGVVCGLVLGGIAAVCILCAPS